MGAMAILAVGAASFAVFYSGKSGISDKFSTSSLFPPIEAHAALAGKDDFQSPRVSSPLLPQAPEYDDGSLVLDEIVPDEDPLDGGRLAIVRPRLDQVLLSRLRFITRPCLCPFPRSASRFLTAAT